MHLTNFLDASEAAVPQTIEPIKVPTKLPTTIPGPAPTPPNIEPIEPNKIILIDI